ncbi:Uma2 family endonuclease [Chloroflexi bacterium TSY]|nr:Uma2 family endonuclease [Chloroflexi bacterium TSY]
MYGWIRWNLLGVPDKSPDIAAIPNAEASTEGKKSYQVGIDGPMPTAVIEVTSDSSRNQDFNVKRDTFASVGIQEYLIIDILNDPSEPWHLSGYLLGNSPYYQQIPPDSEGGITLQSLNLRFVPIQRTRIDVFDSSSGERLHSTSEFKAMAEAEAERANAEAERADTAEAKIEELMTRISKLEASQDQDQSKPA